MTLIKLIRTDKIRENLPNPRNQRSHFIFSNTIQRQLQNIFATWLKTF